MPSPGGEGGPGLARRSVVRHGEHPLPCGQARQHVVGEVIRHLAPVEGWWDAGKPQTLLETNHHVLLAGRGGVDPLATVEDAEIIEPVRLEAGVKVRGGRIGPNVTLEQGTIADGCHLRHTVVEGA